MPRKNSVIVFDIDGTLTDSIASHQWAFERALHSFGFPALRTDWASYRHHSDSAIFAEAWLDARFAGQPDTAALEMKFRSAFHEAMRSRPVKEIPGSSDFLAMLQSSEWAACFATGSLRYGAIRKLEALSVPIDHDLLVTASEHQTREDIVGAAIERAERKHAISEPQRIVSVGDGPWDLLTAQSLGLEFLGVAGGERAEVLRRQGAPVVPDLLQGMALLDLASPSAGR